MEKYSILKETEKVAIFRFSLDLDLQSLKSPPNLISITNLFSFLLIFRTNMGITAVNESDNFLVNTTKPALDISPPACYGLHPTKTFLITTYTTWLLTSLFGNLFVIIIFYRDKSMRSSTNLVIKM